MRSKCILAIFLTVFAAGQVNAQESQSLLVSASQYIRKATESIQKGDWEAAARSYEEGFKNTGHWQFLAYAGGAWLGASTLTDKESKAEGFRSTGLRYLWSVIHGASSGYSSAVVELTKYVDFTRGKRTNVDEIRAWSNELKALGHFSDAGRLLGDTPEAAQLMAKEGNFPGATYVFTKLIKSTRDAGADTTALVAQRDSLQRLNILIRKTLDDAFGPGADRVRGALKIDSLSRALDIRWVMVHVASSLIRFPPNPAAQIVKYQPPPGDVAMARKVYTELLDDGAVPERSRNAIEVFLTTGDWPDSPDFLLPTEYTDVYETKGIYVKKGCDICSGSKDETVVSKFEIPGGLYYASHEINETTKNGNADVSVRVEKSGRVVYVTARAGNHNDCFCLLGSHGPASWIGVDVKIHVSSLPPYNLPTVPAADVELPSSEKFNGLSYTFLNGSASFDAGLRVRNGTGPWKNDVVGPNRPASACAYVTASLARLAGMDALVTGNTITFRKNDKPEIVATNGCIIDKK